MDDREFYFDFLKVQTQVLAQRDQFLLVFQSMMFAGVGVLIGKQPFFPIWVILLLGVVTCTVWLYLNAVAYTNIRRIGLELKEIDARFVLVTNERKRHPFLARGDHTKTMNFFFPSAMLAFWIVLLGFYIAR